MNRRKKKMLYALAVCCLGIYSACSEDDSHYSFSSGSDNSNDATQNPYATRLELPRLKDDGNSILLVHETDAYGVNLCIEWDCTRTAQRWTAYQLYGANSVTNWNRNNWKNTEWGGDPFQPDPDLPADVRTELEQYRRSGYDRGHICPSADRLNSKDANEQTFYLSNMHPQINAFNAGVWLNMENKIRVWNQPSFRDTLYVVKGGTIDGDDKIIRITDKGLPVPKYFFMAILCKNKDSSQSGYKAMAFWVEHTANQDTDLRKYVISIDELEEKTGIDFFCNLPDDIEEKVEGNLVPASWGFNK